jgi:hypothetical protein
MEFKRFVPNFLAVSKKKHENEKNFNLQKQ